MKRILILAIALFLLLTPMALAQGLEGTYSLPLENGEIYLLDLFQVDGSLFGQASVAMNAEDGYQVYSFCGVSFLPQAGGEYTARAFSVMSQGGEYWPETYTCRFALDEDGGLNVTGELPLLTGVADPVLTPDDNVPQTFPYVSISRAESDEALWGVWRQTGVDDPIYLTLAASDVQIYRSAKDSKPFLARGIYYAENGQADAMYNRLGNGAMPEEWAGAFTLDGDTLTLTGDTQMTFVRCPLAGEWTLAMDKMADADQLFTLFGSGLHTVGAGLTLRPDGTLTYNLGYNGGDGTYTQDGDRITATVTDWAEGAEHTLAFRVETVEDAAYVVYEFSDEQSAMDIWWERQ